MAQYDRTPVSRPRNFDGNGKLSPAEKAVGVTVVKNYKGRGWTRNDPRHKNRLATIEDSSVTKQNSEVDKLKKENQDLMLVIKDMDKRLKKMEDGK